MEISRKLRSIDAYIRSEYKGRNSNFLEKQKIKFGNFSIINEIRYE